MTPSERHAAVLEALDQQIGDPFLPVSFRRVLEGCRRILQRHPPKPCTFCPAEHATCVSGCGCEWPCAEWLDASAGVAAARGEDT